MSDIAAGPMRIPFTHWPADRLTDDTAVEARIKAAVLAERERAAKIAEQCDLRPDEWNVPQWIADRIRSGE